MHFTYNGEFYEQVQGVAMGLPLSPVLADFCMEAFKERAIEQDPLKSSLYRRYIDDTLLVCQHGQEALRNFLVHLNGLHI